MGAAAAREAALRGYSTLLLEKVDYAWGTSSRSSKMLHGGIRYLEQGDVLLVAEALREREILSRTAPHLTRVENALFPICPNRGRPAWQVKLGLNCYDTLAAAARLLGNVGPSSGRSTAFPNGQEVSTLSSTSIRLSELGLKHDRLFQYSDGQMDDTRIVVEMVVDASNLGAVTLNHAPVTSISRSRNALDFPSTRNKSRSGWSITWQDSLGGQTHSSQARYLVIAGGPWGAELNKLVGIDSTIKFSRGTHLVFDVDLKLPGLTVPRREAGRYYFVHPLFSALGSSSGKTLVGPTDFAESSLSEDPKSTTEDIEDLFFYLKSDLPNSGLDEKSLLRTFTGQRVLIPSRSAGGTTASMRRRELISNTPGLTSILGGKYTTARAVAHKAINAADLHFGRIPAIDAESTITRPLPGSKDWSPQRLTQLGAELQSALLAEATSSKKGQSKVGGNLSKEEAELKATAATARFGTRAGELIELISNPESVQPRDQVEELKNLPVTTAEMLFSALNEQASTAEDLLYRRLGLWELDSNLEALAELVTAQTGLPRQQDSAPHDLKQSRRAPR